MFRVTVPAAMVITIEYHIFGQVINRIVKTAEFGCKQGKGFGKRDAESRTIFLGVPPPYPRHVGQFLIF